MLIAPPIKNMQSRTTINIVIYFSLEKHRRDASAVDKKLKNIKAKGM